MNKTILLLILQTLFAGYLYGQSKTATLCAQVYGYQGEMIYFDCVQSPTIGQEFHTNPGEEHHYTFQTDELACMRINTRTSVLLEPGDSLHVVVRYEGRDIRSVEFGGTPHAVEANRAYRAITQIKRSLNYKEQLLGCVVLDVKPKKRIADSRLLLEQVNQMLTERNQSGAAAAYMRAEVEAAAYLSFMEYPVMYASTRHLPIEQQEIGAYWELMDDFAPRTDRVSLSSLSYVSMLMRYCFYENEKKAVATGTKYSMPVRFETMFAELAAFYDGTLREYVLYTLLCNFVREGKELDRVDPLLKEYKEKYDPQPKHLQILETLLQ